MSSGRPWVLGALVVVVLVVVATIAWRAMGQAAPAAGSSGSSGASGAATGSSGAGWSSGSAVQTNAAIREFLDDLASRLGFPVYVTSGIRTAEDQARAMLKKVELGGEDELDLYKRKDLVAELLATPQTQEAWASVIAEQISRGDLLSSHLSGRAFDLRTTGSGTGQLSETQIATVIQAAAELGAKKVLREDTPPHLHFELSA